MRFLSRPELRERFEGKTVAIVGSGPGAVDNEPGFIDGHDVVVRVNNYKLTPETGARTDVFYSFFGTSIKKHWRELKRDGVTLCMSKVPDSRPIHSRWHIERGRLNGIDFRYIYRNRTDWWFCDTYIPDDAAFVEKYNLLGERVPTTGFAAILDILSFDPKSVFLTGFDFFRSGIHNVNERWESRNHDDPIGHKPESELAWLQDNLRKHPIMLDRTLQQIVGCGPDPTLSAFFDFRHRAEAAGGPRILKRSALNLHDGASVLQRLLDGKGYRTVLEIGTYRGVSAAWMAQFCDRVVTIDLAQGQMHKHAPDFDRMAFWDALGIRNIDLHLVENDQAKGALINGLDFDFAFIDGDHRARGPAKDFELVRRCGTVLFHDCDPRNPSDVSRFVASLPRHQVEQIGIFALWKA
jgi:predicted O-methyltransferase YrrM